MAGYSIFALGESQITVGGGQLDGVTQGNGSHMVGLTVTLNSNAWEEMLITDNDANFQDSDSSQRLDGAQSFDGVNYANNTMVEAEYSIVLSDGTNSWTAIAFNINNSSPSYGTVEGLAFIGGPGGFPPVGVELDVVSSAEGPSFAAAAYATPICFARGTLIDTATGPRPVERLVVGDLIRTADNNFQPLRWIGGKEVLGVGRFAPVQIGVGQFGARAPVLVSQQHRVVIRSAETELLFGAQEVFAAAGHLVDGQRVRLMPGRAVEYFHLALDRHEIVFANGVAAESLYFAERGTDGELAQLQRFFPDLATVGLSHRKTARSCLRRRETELVLARAGGVEWLEGLGHNVRVDGHGGKHVRRPRGEQQDAGAGIGQRDRGFGRLVRRSG